MHTLTMTSFNEETGEATFNNSWKLVVDEKCAFEEIAKQYAERGKSCPPLCLVCNCKKCSPQCNY